MKKSLTLIFQILISLLAVAVLAFMLIEPTREGVNVNKPLLDIYFKDALLAYAYIGSIAFFTALYKTFKALGYYRQDKVDSAVKSLLSVKYSLIVFVLFVLGGQLYLFLFERNKSDDIAGGIMMGLIIIVISTLVILATNLFRKRITSKNL